MERTYMVMLTGYWPFLAFVDLDFHQFVSVQLNAKLKKHLTIILLNNIFTVLSNMTNDSLNLFVSSFVSFSINGLKENAENLNYYPILRRKVELYLFLSTHRE